MRSWQAVTVALVTTTSIVACSQDDLASPSLEQQAWAAEIERAATTAEEQNNQLLITALSDKKITETELQHIEGKFDSCLKEAGFDGGGYLTRLDGGINVEGSPQGISPDEQQDLVQRCVDDSGIEIVNFAVQQRLNPHNEDMVALSSRCMKARKLIDKEYTQQEIADLTQVVESLSPEDQKKAAECNHDPRKFLDGSHR